MSKVEVNGSNADEAWRFCKAAIPGEVQWNFAAWFLVDQQGQARCVGAYRPMRASGTHSGRSAQVVGRFSSRELAKLDGELARLVASPK